MHADLISETNRAETEIYGDPEIDDTDIDVEAVFCDQDISYDVYEKSGDAEPDKKGRLTQNEESRKAYYQKQDYRVDYVSKTFDALGVQNSDLPYRSP